MVYISCDLLLNIEIYKTTNLIFTNLTYNKTAVDVYN